MVETADMVLVSGFFLEIFRLSSSILSTQVHISTTRILCTTTDWSEYSHLFLQELVSHGQEGNGEAAAEEQDEVSSQLVSVVDGGGGEGPGGEDSSLGYLGKHIGSLVEVNQAIL